MHICRAHKYRNLQSFIFKIFYVRHLFYHHYLAVCRTNYLVMSNRKISFRRAKKRNNKQQHYKANAKYNPGHYWHCSTKEKEENNINGSENQCTQGNRSVALLMNIHQLNLITNIKIEREMKPFISLPDE